MVLQRDQRREDRGSVVLPGGIRHNVTSRAEVKVTDLSARGCRIEAPGRDLDQGSAVFIRLDQLAPLRANVRWYEAGFAGLEFDQPLYVAVLDHLIARWPNRMTAELVTI